MEKNRVVKMNNKFMYFGSLLTMIIFFIGCINQTIDSDNINDISLSTYEWKEENESNGLTIRISFVNNEGKSIKIIDKINLKIIYKKDTSEEIKIYDKMIEIQEDSYICNVLGIYSSFFNIPYSDFNGSIRYIKNYTVIVEYKGISDSNKPFMMTTTPLSFFELSDSEQYVSSYKCDELFKIRITSGDSIKFSDIEFQIKYTSEGSGKDNQSNKWISIQIESTKTNQEGDLIAWTKDVGYYSYYRTNKDPKDSWDVGEEFVVCETGKKDLIASNCTIYVKIIYLITDGIILQHFIDVN